MKLKSLILGSVAAAGLSTGAFAADLGVLTSLDVCDALGLSGLTISSDTNCLQISGKVSYEFNWGDYNADLLLTTTSAGAANIMDNGGAAGDELDWSSKVEAWLKFVGTADSDFGPAKAVIKLKAKNESKTVNEGPDGATGPGAAGGSIALGSDAVAVDEAYVQVGDTTVIMAGKKGSIAKDGDDEPFNFLGLFNSEAVDAGVGYTLGDIGNIRTGGQVIQVVSDLGNGVSVGLGLEDLNGTNAAVAPSTEVGMAGTLVGVISYTGEGITAHVTGLAGGILDGTINDYAMHAGFTGTFDAIKFRAALAAGTDVLLATSYWNALASAQGTFDMFTVAVSGEATGGTGLDNDYGIGGSIGATVSDGVTINLGGRYYQDGAVGGPDGTQIAAQLVAAVTETITITAEAGMYSNNAGVAVSDFYGAAQLAWAPGGGFTSSIKGEAHQSGGYKVTFKAAKSFE